LNRESKAKKKAKS